MFERKKVHSVVTRYEQLSNKNTMRDVCKGKEKYAYLITLGTSTMLSK